MPNYNADRIRYLIGEMNAAFRKLDAIPEIGEAEFLSNPEKIDGAKYNLIVAIEAAIDVCNHIAAGSGGRAPRDYGDCFAVLGELGILAPDLIDRLRRMAKFRNLLIHLYWQVDDKKVFKFICEDLKDIKAYLKAIETLLAPR